VAGSAGGAPQAGSSRFSVDVKEVDPITAPLITSAMGAEGELVEARLARGCRCFGAWLGDDLAGYGWLSTGPEWIGEIELEITPAQGEAYVWNCVTLTRHRRKGVFRGLIDNLVAQGQKEGFKRLWIGSVRNLAEKAIVQAGFAPVIRFHTASRLGFRWRTIVYVKELDPSLVAAAGEVISIKPGSSVQRSKRRRH
jgi:GNAT superfamily N-acetyltransferase